MITSFGHHLLIAPSYANVLNVYAVRLVFFFSLIPLRKVWKHTQYLVGYRRRQRICPWQSWSSARFQYGLRVTSKKL